MDDLQSHQNHGLNWLAFLDRIVATRTEPDLSTLKHLQQQALLTLPFENLDIHLGKPIRLDHNAVYAKIVSGDRGGFCYELNECLYQCLAAMGYEVERLECRVELGGAGSPFDHQITLVRIDGARWMADIGFGDSASTPLNLDERSAQTDGRSWFRIAEQKGYLELFTQGHSGDWSKVLSLNPEPQPWSHFTERCHWTQTSTDSAFVHKRLCTLALPNGRISLSGNTLKETGESVSEIQIQENEYTTVLSERFGISLDTPNWRRPLD
jgi:N-hydroxyarylamine O-acetyltransferase